MLSGSVFFITSDGRPSLLQSVRKFIAPLERGKDNIEA